jgi:hypothetical protein
MTDNRPMADGTAEALRHLRTVPLLRGLPLNVRGAIAYGLDADCRLRLCAERAPEHQRGAYQDGRRLWQESTRFNMACAGLLGFSEVFTAIPLDAEGRDVEVSELLAVPWDQITAAVAAAYGAEAGAEGAQDAQDA